MQKKLLALAVAGLASGVASAQTNVTIYGVLDMGYVYSSGSLGREAAPTPSAVSPGSAAGNRLGFKGEEALGNGLKAVFTLEYGLTLTTTLVWGPSPPAPLMASRLASSSSVCLANTEPSHLVVNTLQASTQRLETMPSTRAT
ncbi:MAG: porin [Candidatus Accumulibacter sp.]|nr:porin [Accumulibacter sp.]